MSPQSPDPSSDLLTQAVKASQASYSPLRHSVLHSVHPVYCPDCRTHDCGQVPQPAGGHSAHELDAAHQPQEQRHDQPDNWNSSCSGNRRSSHVRRISSSVVGSSSSLRALYVLSGVAGRSYKLRVSGRFLTFITSHGACLCKTASHSVKIIRLEQASPWMDIA